MEDEQRYIHPMSGETIVGKKLEPGTILKATDVYDSHLGKWEKCPLPGCVIPQETGAMWVRPKENVA